MNEKIILTDVDGVLVSWIDRFHEWMSKRGFEVIDESQYSIEGKFQINKELANNLANEFSNCEEIMTLRAFDDAKEYVTRIAQEFGYKFRVITSLSNEVKTQRWRRINLESNFGPVFDEIICLPHGDNKHTTLLDYEKSKLIWVEDKVENAELGSWLGLNSFLINRPYNQYRNWNSNIKFNRIDSWKEIYEYVKSCESS